MLLWGPGLSFKRWQLAVLQPKHLKQLSKAGSCKKRWQKKFIRKDWRIKEDFPK